MTESSNVSNPTRISPNSLKNSLSSSLVDNINNSPLSTLCISSPPVLTNYNQHNLITPSSSDSTSPSNTNSIRINNRLSGYDNPFKLQRQKTVKQQLNYPNSNNNNKSLHTSSNPASDTAICSHSHLKYNAKNIFLFFLILCVYSYLYCVTEADSGVVIVLPIIISGSVNYFELSFSGRKNVLAASFPFALMCFFLKVHAVNLTAGLIVLIIAYGLCYYTIACLESIQQHANLLNQAKNNFISSITHDLRTPLHAILGTCQVMNSSNKYDANLSAEQLEHLQLIEDGGRSLLSLVNSMLDISKIENGKMQLHYATIDLWALTDKCIELLLQLAENKGIEFYNLISNKVPRYVTADGFRLEQILMNLLGNGIKFTQHGSVILTVDAFPVESPARSEKVRLVFSVIDTGVGVSEDQQSKLFGKFEQANSSINVQFGGSGLGLFICKQLCNLMGAAIKMESKLGQGTKFIVEIELPIAPDSPKHNAIELLGDEAHAALCNYHRQTGVYDRLSPQNLVKPQMKLLSLVPEPHHSVVAEYSKIFRLAVTKYSAGELINLKDYQLIITDLDNITALHELFQPVLHSTAAADLSYSPYIFLLRGGSDRSRDLVDNTKEFINQFLSLPSFCSPSPSRKLSSLIKWARFCAA
jgi:signal transduction histidine kinase